MSRCKWLLWGVFFVCWLPATYANQVFARFAQDTASVQPVQEQLDSLGRSTPQGTLKGFFQTLSAGDYLKASAYLNLPAAEAGADSSRIVSLVKKIEVVLNREGSILPANLVNDSPEGNTNDGLDPSLEEVGSISTDSTSIPIYLELAKKEDESTIWLVASRTTSRLLEEIAANEPFYEEKLSADGLWATRWEGAAISDWMGMVFLALGAYALAWLFTLFIRWLAHVFRPNFRNYRFGRILRTLLIPLRLVLAVGILLYLSRQLGISIVVRQSFSVVNLIAMWTALFIFIWLAIDTATSLGEEKLRETKRFGGLSAISFFRNTAKFILIVVALLVLFDTVGVNVTAGLAALGVGGIALALGAQKTIENVIGGLSVVFDQPVSVGDFCKFGDTLGTVEKIGMRSTRIRTTSRTVVTVPNSDFSSRLIENYSKRDLFLFQTTIGLRYETSSDQMRYILVELRKLLYAHPKVDPNPARVRFLGYGSDALQVELFAYTHATDYNDYLGIQEDLNLRLAQVIEESGSGFAFPSQTLYISRDEGLSETRKEEAEAKVAKWKENGELELPEFDPKTIESLRGTLDYPPKTAK